MPIVISLLLNGSRRDLENDIDDGRSELDKLKRVLEIEQTRPDNPKTRTGKAEGNSTLLLKYLNAVGATSTICHRITLTA